MRHKRCGCHVCTGPKLTFNCSLSRLEILTLAMCPTIRPLSVLSRVRPTRGTRSCVRGGLVLPGRPGRSLVTVLSSPLQ